MIDIATKGNVEIELEEGDYYRRARLQPKGYWTAVVTVFQSRYGGSWKEPEIKGSSGGEDETLPMLEQIDNLIEAFNYAKEIYADWKQRP